LSVELPRTGQSPSPIVEGSMGVTSLPMDASTKLIQPATRELYAVDKANVKLALIEDRQRIREYDVVGPIGILVAVAPSASATYKAFTTGNADTGAGFYLLATAIGVWLLVRLGYRFFKHPPMTIDDLVDKCVRSLHCER
jgi:hypothetical protein